MWLDDDDDDELADQIAEELADSGALRAKELSMILNADKHDIKRLVKSRPTRFTKSVDGWMLCARSATVGSGARSFSSSADGGERVWITGGGSVYHTDPDCRLLRMGWAKVLEDGGHITHRHSVTIPEARSMGRRACSGC